MPNFDRRISFVTGAGSGIGQAMALALAAEGSTVVCSDINEQTARATAARVEEIGAKGVANALDTADEEAVKESLIKTQRDLGRLDVLMNNAGVAGKDWDTTTAINFSGVYYGLMHACPLMAEQGGGAVVNTASVAGLGALMRQQVAYHKDPAAVTGVASYVAAKHGVVGLTKQFAVAYGETGVRVNAVCPGYIETPIITERLAHDRGREYLEDLHPIGRLGKPEEVAKVAAFLASEDASFVTGVAMPVDGGYSAR
ncbi:MAG: SDR family NAD(P)-dependent oxidoreductase [Pseudomonadota bacterium]|nr:SDR family NAD(P)-dependent oxidoreductase [Pseudomonadota bacterium]